MRIHSIRVKVMLPIVSLALILVGLFGFMIFMSSMQANAMRTQADHYFEAISEVLNADRDIYQARLAQERMILGEGDFATNEKNFLENAQQVDDRFQMYRKYLENEPSELTEPFLGFDDLYKTWREQSDSLSFQTSKQVRRSEQLQDIERQFIAIRTQLDQAGEELRKKTREVEAQINATILGRHLESISAVINADRDLYQARLAFLHMINGIGVFEENKQSFQENAQQVVEHFNEYRMFLRNEPELTEPYRSFDADFNHWYQASLKTLEDQDAFTAKAMPSGYQEVENSFEAIRTMLDQAGERVQNYARSMEDRTNQQIAQFQTVAIVVIGIAFIAALVFGYLVPLTLTKNIEHISHRIREIAEGDGDLTQRIQSQAKDELGDLAHEFDGFVERLRSMISVVSEQSRQLGSMTVQLKDAADKTQTITTSLVNSSEFIVSAGHQMTMSNQQMAGVASDTAKEAADSNSLTSSGIKAVNESHQAVSRLVNEIELALSHSMQLEQSSASIASVLEVIRNIAEQTNLLALNAAIEAARAGEQGRGFAVVADEVRTLATRTQDSTNEIETMISQLKQSVKASAESTQLSRQNATNTAANFDQVITIFDAIHASFSKVEGLASQTAQATHEQADVANNLNINLTALKGQTDSVQDVSNHINQQSNKISELYKALQSQVGSFKV